MGDGGRGREKVFWELGQEAEPQLPAPRSHHSLVTSKARAPPPSHKQLEPESQLPQGNKRAEGPPCQTSSQCWHPAMPAGGP